MAPPWLPVPPTAYGGIETVVDRLATGLDRLGVEVTVVAHADSTHPRTARGLRLPPGRAIGDRDEEIRWAEAVYRHLVHLDLDVVHDHTLSGPAVARATGATQRWPIVTTSHGPFDEEAERFLAMAVPCVSIVAISRAQAATACRVRPAAVIHHGLDVDEFPEGDGSGGYAACLARMDPSKGLDRAIEVARRADVPLRIAAKMRSPEELAYFDAVIRPRLGGSVEYVGELGHPDKLRLLADAVALVNPIRWSEPFGMAMLESLACGTPVLAAPNGAAPEIVEHGRVGFLCDDVAAMAEALRRVDGLDRAACRRRVAERFSVERMARAHVALYRRLSEGRVAAGVAGRGVLRQEELTGGS